MDKYLPLIFHFTQCFTIPPGTLVKAKTTWLPRWLLANHPLCWISNSGDLAVCLDQCHLVTGDMVVVMELDAPVGFVKSTPEGEAKVKWSAFWKR